jgi:uncharacterized protein involved in outer membrane biogenesis
MLKNIFRIFLILAGFVLLALFCLTLLLKVSFPEKRIKWLASNLSRAYLYREISIGHITYQLPWNIYVDKFSISEEPNFKSGTFISVENVQIKPQILPLLHGKMVFGKILVSSPDINLIKWKNGKFNFEDLKKLNFQKLRVHEKLFLATLKVSEFDVTNGKLKYTDLQDAKGNLVAEPFDIGIKNVSLSQPFDFTLKSKIRNETKSFETDISGNLDIAANSIRLEKSIFKDKTGQLDLSGKIENCFGPKSISTDLRLSGDRSLLEDFLELAGLSSKVSIGEQPKVDVEIKTEKDKITVTGIK